MGKSKSLSQCRIRPFFVTYDRVLLSPPFHYEQDCSFTRNCCEFESWTHQSSCPLLQYRCPAFVSARWMSSRRMDIQMYRMHVWFQRPRFGAVAMMVAVAMG